MTVYDQADSGLAKLAAKRAGINSRALAVAVSKIATITRLKAARNVVEYHASLAERGLGG